MSTLEQMLAALVNGESIDITPRTRVETFLKNCVDACGCGGLPIPRTRVEALLYELADKISENADGSALVEEYLLKTY